MSIYQEYFMYIINAFLIQIIGSHVIEMSLRDSVLFAAIALGSFLFINKIFHRILLRIFRFRSGSTVRQQLQKACPENKRAKGMINIGNLASYDDYLFSGCKKKGTCDAYEPDVISKGIINKKEHCGSWDLKSTGLTYSPVKGWSKEVDCNKYNNQSSFLPDKCLKELWKESKCTNIAAADKQYPIWKKQNKAAIKKDLTFWKNLKDNTHRTLCYGADKGRWPQNPPVKFSVGEDWKLGAHRTMMNNPAGGHGGRKYQGRDMNYGGWSLLLNFYAYEFPQPGTKKYAVGHAWNPHRIWIIEDGRDLNFNGWTHLFNFYAFPSAKPGTIKISVGYATGPYRIMFTVNDPLNMNHRGWKNLTTFYAYPNDNI